MRSVKARWRDSNRSVKVFPNDGSRNVSAMGMEIILREICKVDLKIGEKRGRL